MEVIGVGMAVCSLGVISVIEAELGRSGTGLLSVIVCKLKRRKEGLSILILKCKATYELLNNLDHSFRLSISLRMFCRRHEKMYSQDLVQSFTKM